MTRHAAIYLNAKAGVDLALAQQRADCEALAASLGWTVVGVYEDIGASMFLGRVQSTSGC